MNRQKVYQAVCHLDEKDYAVLQLLMLEVNGNVSDTIRTLIRNEGISRGYVVSEVQPVKLKDKKYWMGILKGGEK